MTDFEHDDGPVAPPRVLDKADAISPVWHKLKTHLEAQLLALRKRNDNPRLDPIETAALRGEIKAVLNLLTLGNQDPADAANEDEPE